jgi:hypothetical protein
MFRTTMNAKRLGRNGAISLLAAGPAGGFLFGVLNAGDPDPNPIGRVVHAAMMAVVTPLHAGFPPHGSVGAGQTLNLWPHIATAGLLIFGWLCYRDRRAARKSPAPPP